MEMIFKPDTDVSRHKCKDELTKYARNYDNSIWSKGLPIGTLVKCDCGKFWVTRVGAGYQGGKYSDEWRRVTWFDRRLQDRIASSKEIISVKESINGNNL